MPELIPLRESEEIFNARNQLNLRAASYFRNLTSMVNTSTEDVGEINTQLAQNLQSIARINELEKIREKVVPTTTSSGVKAFETHICKNVTPITKTLDVNSKKGDIVTIKRRGAKVTIIGTINGKTDLVINRKQSAPKLAFDGIDWSTV